MADERLKALAERPVGRLLWSYSLPAVVGMAVMQLYNIVDRMLLGQCVGKEALAGLAITFPVMNIATALGVLVGAGSAARMSIALGRGDVGEARKITGNALTLTLTVGTAYLLFFALFIDQLLTLFGATPETLPYARTFMLYILPGLLLTNLTFSFNNLMRASGFPTRAMVTMFIGAGLNVMLAWMFVYLFRWGIKGAAIATDISMFVSMVFVMWHFVRPHGSIYFTRGIYGLAWRRVAGIVSIGAAPCIINIAGCAVNILINHYLYRYGGVDAIAAAGVFVTVTSLLVCVVLGICQGMQPIAGYNYGAGQYGRLRRVFWLAVIASTVVTTCGFVISRFVPDAIAKVFLPADDTSLIATTGNALRLSMTIFWAVGFQVVATNFFQSIGKVGQSIFLSLTRQVLFVIPLLLILPGHYGLDGVWSSFPAADTFATVVTIVMVWMTLSRLPKT